MLGWLVSVLAVCGGVYAALAATLTGRFLAAPMRDGDAFPALTVLKPLHGAQPGLVEALESFAVQDYPGPVQLLFGVQDPADPAVAVVRQLQERHPALDIGLAIDPRRHGANRKVSNLINIAAVAKHGVLILSDADIRAPADYLRRVTAALAEPGVGTVTCLYVGDGAGNLWSRLAAMAIDYQFLPGAILGRALGLAQPCFGSTIAITARVLREIGGLAAFADFLADDYEIGRVVRQKGYKIAIPAMTVTHVGAEAGGRDLLAHELRWARTIWRIEGAGHAGSLVTHGLPLSLIGAALLGFPPVAVWLIFAILGVRIWAKFRIDAATGADAGPWWLIPVRDVLSFAVFLASFAGDTVDWQGRRYRVRRDGVLTEL